MPRRRPRARFPAAGQPVAAGPATLEGAHRKQHHRGCEHRHPQGGVHRQKQVGQDWHQRRQSEAGAHDERAAHRVGVVVDDQPELLLDHCFQQDLLVAGQIVGDPHGSLVVEALLLEQKRHLRLGLKRALLDFAGLGCDLRFEDLALALARHVFARGHAEDAGQRGRQTGDQDGERLAGGSTHGADHRQHAGQAVLRAKDRLAHLAEHTGLAALPGQEVRAARLGRSLPAAGVACSRIGPVSGFVFGVELAQRTAAGGRLGARPHRPECRDRLRTRVDLPLRIAWSAQRLDYPNPCADRPLPRSAPARPWQRASQLSTSSRRSALNQSRALTRSNQRRIFSRSCSISSASSNV